MFSKKISPSTLPIQFEGTHGVYAKRESPPKIPPTHSMAANISPANMTLSGVPLLSETPRLGMVNFENKFDLSKLRRQSHTPQHNTRKAAPRHELSSHSFNVTYSTHGPHSNTRQHRFGKPASMENTQDNQEADLQFNKGRLGPSISFGNFVEPFIIPPISQQHVYAAKNNNAQHSIDQNIDETGKLDLDRLPPGWEICLTEDGAYRYYVDHNNGRTHWIHPLAPENLIPGWTKIYDSVHGVVYYNHAERRSQFDHPGINNVIWGVGGSALPTILGSASIHSMETKPGTEQHEDLHEEDDVNIINNDDVPEWLKLYSQAPFNSDHLLNFNLFKLNQLELYDCMIMRLYKQEIINTVVKFDCPISQIDNELVRRQYIPSFRI